MAGVQAQGAGKEKAGEKRIVITAQAAHDCGPLVFIPSVMDDLNWITIRYPPHPKGGNFIAREKTTGFYFKLSPQEWDWLEKKMALAGIRNKSAYIRKMCIDGYVIRLDLPELKECSRLLRSASNNLNQIARRANSGGGLYPDEIVAVRASLDDNRALFGKILDGLAKIK
ncbi:MobC family plasmid mobilization relaxosome protein [Ruminococcaceae bacterium OttesenSCG-928-L11]|nr:MobC family plasmid mobilization relaxosome protein [Ruminococcaceae bacterium OttesenSCG-928-L11]